MEDVINKIRLEYHLLDKCNLNCRSCSHFCSLVKYEEVKSLDKIAQDFTKIHQLTNNGDARLVDKITVMGGEPLMYKEINKALAYIRSLFKEVPVVLLTNGFLLPAMKDDFYDVIRSNNIIIMISLYTFSYESYKEIYAFLDTKRIRWDTYTIFENNKRVFETKFFNLHHNPDYAARHYHCRWRQTCTQLVDGRLYLCALIAYFKYFDEEFKGQHDMMLDESDYIDLDRINSYEELWIERDKVPHFCGYCRGLGLNLEEWRHTKKDISEWVYYEANEKNT